jgi:hypothetical protein
MKSAIIAGVLLFISASASTQSGRPATERTGPWTFKNYPAEASLKGRPAKPLLVTPLEHAYRTQILEQARKGPNFAGRFTLAKWGCGSPCLAFVIIDTASGTVYDPGFSVGCADKNGLGAEVDFKRTSRLLVTTGYSEEVGCGTDFYEWDGKQLSLIHFEGALAPVIESRQGSQNF